MPFGKWTAEPVFMRRNTALPDKTLRDFDLETVVHGSFLKCLQQLASVVKIADRIFDDIGSDCRVVFDRIDRLKIKIGVCEEAVLKLDARAVQVPVSNLNAASKLLRRQKPYKTIHEPQIQFFLPSNRPPCIDKLYNEACATPVSVICTVDRYRTDGCTSSQLFMVTPVLGKARRKKMLDIETRKPASFSLATTEQDDQKDGGKSLGEVDELPCNSSGFMSLGRLPSPEEQAMAVSLEYPSSVVPVDVSGSSFLRMIKCRRSLIHADFQIKRRKDKSKQKRRHTVCEGNSKGLEEAVENITMVNSSCQTEDLPEAPSTFFRRSFCRRRSKSIDSARRETVALDGLDLDFGRKEAIAQTAQQDTSTTSSLKKKNGQGFAKKQGKLSLMTRATNPILSLSAALSNAVKMRHSKSLGKQDDGRSSSGNWSASSSTRASMDSDQQHAVIIAADRNSNVSRSSAGKDSVLSDSTQQESVKSQESETANRSHTSASQSGKTRILQSCQQWDFEQDRGRESNTSTPERSSDCASTPLVTSPYVIRRNRLYPPSTLDDGESSVYSVDTDGYYTSMHTDSGLWNAIYADSVRTRHRRESQSSISTIGNGSINSILSRTVTENSSNNNSLKRERPAPEPPVRGGGSSFKPIISPEDTATVVNAPITALVNEGFEKEISPFRNGSASESDHEVADRIRVKATINSSRYPSMCAVSPETSDEEVTDVRRKSKSPTVSVVVAEVHQEEVTEKDTGYNKLSEGKRYKVITSDSLISAPRSPPAIINMYGSHSPAESFFDSSLFCPGQMTTSTPKRNHSTTSFAADTNGSVAAVTKLYDCPPKQQLSPKLSSGVKSLFHSGKDSGVTSPKSPHKLMSSNCERIMRPLKYVPCITVTATEGNDPGPKVSDKSRLPAEVVATVPTRSKSFLRNPLSNLPFRHTESPDSKAKKSSPSYVSFQSPDSPVSSSTGLSHESSVDVSNAPKTETTVVLDALDKVIYSNSLNRTKGDSKDRFISKYATLPKYQPSNYFPKVPPKVTDDVLADESWNNSSIPVARAAYRPANHIDNRRSQSMQNAPAAFGDSTPRSEGMFFRPSRGGRFCRTYFPSHILSSSPQITSAMAPPSPSGSIKSESSVSSRSSYGNKAETESQSGAPLHDAKTSCANRPNVSRPSEERVLRNKSVLAHPDTGPFDSHPAVQSRVVADSVSCTRGSPHSPAQTVASTYLFRPLNSSQESNKAQDLGAYTFSTPKNSLQASTAMFNTPISNVAETSVEVLRGCATTNNYSYEQPRKNSSRQSEFTPPNPPDVIPSSSTPPSTLDVTYRTTSDRGNKQLIEPMCNQTDLKSLSSNELFAIIHNSKKKHNIKSESEKSFSPLSSRSSSPCTSIASSPARASRIETGVLTRQNNSRLADGNKSAHPRFGNLAIDRLGRAKPTSMHDFKMLLLQARGGGGGGQNSSSRPSAAELLKVSPPKSSSSPVESAIPRLSSPVPKTYVPQSAIISPTYSALPVKRNLRTRSPYLTRYDSVYPPIWEDCLEEMEAADENENTVNAFHQLSQKDSMGNMNYPLKTSMHKENEKRDANRSSTWV